MWPWSHAAVGYLCYSIGTRLVGRRPTTGPTVAVLFGALLPDLVDKPLSWVFGQFRRDTRLLIRCSLPFHSESLRSC
ncbi:hypothetical protein ACFQL7_23110 [Halocatena marina]|uniref:Uncharacterized protein n=1 Tax=Halocatena marina TaxID=2934937 RepID=A0ABD5YTG0_9EURY